MGWFTRTPKPQPQPKRRSPDLQAFADNVIGWCRALTADPGADRTLAFERAAREAGTPDGWVQVDEHWYVFADDTHGRSGPALPPDVDPRTVPRIMFDPDATPARDALAASLANVELALMEDWAVDNEEAMRAGAGHVLNWPETQRSFSEHYSAACRGAARRLLEIAEDADDPKLLAPADELTQAIAYSAERAYAEFRTDASSCAWACLMRDLWLGSAGHRRPVLALVAGLAAAGDESVPKDAAAHVGASFVGGVFRDTEEAWLEHMLERIGQQADNAVKHALGLPPRHAEFFNALHEAAMRQCIWVRMLHALDALHHSTDYHGQRFRQLTARSSRVAQEGMVRLGQALVDDAEDLVGLALDRDRDRIAAERRRGGESSARAAALELTVHTFHYPRSLEPYLLGEPATMEWKHRLAPR